MLKALHRLMEQEMSNIPVYGVNCGSLGFLLNTYKPGLDLVDRISSAVATPLHPIEMLVQTTGGQEHIALAVNEVALLRETHQSAHLSVTINQKVRMTEFVGDGIMVATAAGSSAYNFAAYGPIIPLNTNALLLTPISPFRPRRWHGAIIPCNSIIRLEVLDPIKRPISASADSIEVREVISAEIRERRDITLNLLFDPDESFEERVLREQFSAI